MNRLERAASRYIAASSAISHTFDPTDEMCDELDAAKAEYHAAEEAEAETEAQAHQTTGAFTCPRP